MSRRLRTLYDPARFQSNLHADGWFEGWYFKLVDAAGRHPIAVIPGVSRDERGGTSHAFVQVLQTGGAARYHRYPLGDFTFDADRFEIGVGPNRFSSGGMSLDLPDEGAGALRGDVSFGPWQAWPVSVLSPGIMGWYRFVPRMECYHGVLSLDHTVSGHFTCGAETLDFTGGHGYTEKDWGTSFPSSWVWTQCNTFDASPHTSVTCSVARIPWLGSSFTGHIAGVWHDGVLHRFTTYTGSRLESVETHPGGARVVCADRRKRLAVTLTGARHGSLKAPVQGAMNGRADESLDARIDVELTVRSGRSYSTVFAGTGRCVGAEIMNERGELYSDR